MPYAHLSTGRMHYLEYGNPSPARTALFLHGLGGAGWAGYAAPAACLAQAGYRCLVPDLPGFGFSEHPSACTPEAQTAALAQFLLATGVQGQVTLISHGSGAVPAVLLAERLGARADQLLLAEPCLTLADFDCDLQAVQEAEDPLLRLALSQVSAEAFRQHIDGLRAALGDGLINRILWLPARRRCFRGAESSESIGLARLRNGGIPVETITGAGAFIHLDQPLGFAAALKTAMAPAPGGGETGRLLREWFNEADRF